MTDDRTLTEAEVLEAARAIRELQALRRLATYNGGGTIKIDGVVSGLSSIPMTANEFQAVLALLMERHALLLAGLNIELEKELA